MLIIKRSDYSSLIGYLCCILLFFFVRLVEILAMATDGFGETRGSLLEEEEKRGSLKLTCTTWVLLDFT